jgi:prepilin-type N-terminal cleavage/methylation domain-containing protein
MNLNKKGFSILETLVTVGIMGILTSIAVPSYRSYVRHAKTAEAQSSLGQVYMAQKAFHLQWRFFTGDLMCAGVAPEGEMLYNVGFSTTGTPNSSYTGTPIKTGNEDFYKLCDKGFGSGKMHNCAFKNKHNKNGFQAPPIPASVDIDGNTKNTIANSSEFVAVAIGDIINREPKRTQTTTFDVWSIDNYKQVVRINDGTKE